jgi:polyribonucleotide 5'-hydroxyl-kinase
LSAYAVRLDRTPIFVDLDLGQGSYIMPGTICAMPLEKMNMSVEDGFSKSMPLAYFHGHVTPQGNSDLYKKLISTLALKVESRLEKDPDAKASGVIINTCGYIDKGGYDSLMHAIHAFHVDVILVMGHEKLYSLLSSSLGSQMPIILLPTSGGVVTRDQDVRRRHRKARIKQYFYGSPKHTGGFTFSPQRQEIKLKSIRLLRAGGVQISEGMRLVGESAETDNCSLTRVMPSADLAGSIVAVLQPEAEMGDGSGTAVGSKETISPQLATANVAGFLNIVSVDLEQDTMTVLSPCVGALPSKFLLVGNFKWME